MSTSSVDSNDALRLSHIRDYAREAVALLHGRDRSDLDVDRLLQLAMAELLRIISEAARHVTQPGRTAHSAVPWTEIVALSDRVQDYDFRIDNDFVWRTARYDLPVLIAHLEDTGPGIRGPRFPLDSPPGGH
jgi:uncharacterized protein with HEPN domain